MNRLFFDEFFKMFGLTPNFVNHFEIISVMYKDKDGIHESVLNKNLYDSYKKENSNSICEDTNDKNENCETVCACGECESCMERLEKEMLAISNDFLSGKSMRIDCTNSISNVDDLKEGDYIYAKSNNSSFYGIFRERVGDTFYFYLTITSDEEEEPSEMLAFNDCCFNPDSWCFYSVTDSEKHYIDAVLAAEEWRFDSDKKRFYIAS